MITMSYSTAGCFSCGDPSHIARNCPHSGTAARATYLAEIEDSEGHPMAMRVPVGVIPHVRPSCKHKHSRLCAHNLPVTRDN